jgi:hypothetical protein
MSKEIDGLSGFITIELESAPCRPLRDPIKTAFMLAK